MARSVFTALPELPKRQGFYKVRLAEGREIVAEFRERHKHEGKCWWEWVSEDPTIDKQPRRLEGVVAWTAATQAEVEKALKRSPTRAERIEVAFEQYERFRNERSCRDAPPPSRLLAPGTPIELGALRDCVVVETRDEGRLVLFEYWNVKHHYGTDIDLGRAFMVSHWTDCVPKRSTGPAPMMRRSLLTGSYLQTGLSGLISRMRRGVDDSPDFQRGYVWTQDDQEQFLDTVFCGRDLGRFIIVGRPYPERDWVLDGKQRLNCLWQFVGSRIAYRGHYWHELDPHDRGMFESRVVQVAEIEERDYKRSDLLQIFLEVNVAGVPQTEEHLARVRALLSEAEAAEAV